MTAATSRIDWAQVHARIEASILALEGGQAGPRAQQLVQERTRHLASRTSGASEPTVPLLMLHAGGEVFALRLVDVAEVAEMTAAAALPRASTSLVGIVNRHGVLCRVHDLAALCGLAAGGTLKRAGGHLVVLRSHEGQVGLRVDRADAIREAASSELETAQDAAQTRLGRYTKGGFNLLLPAAILTHLAPSEAF